MTLADVPPGATASVTQVGGDPAVTRRLASLGFRPGTQVACLRRAPLGDPAVYRLRGYEICLRRREAGRVSVSAAMP